MDDAYIWNGPKEYQLFLSQTFENSLHRKQSTQQARHLSGFESLLLRHIVFSILFFQLYLTKMQFMQIISGITDKN